MTSNLGRAQSDDKNTAEMLCKLLIGIQLSRQDPLSMPESEIRGKG